MLRAHLANAAGIGLFLAATLELIACKAADEPATDQASTTCTSAVETLCSAYADHDQRCGDTTPTERDQELAECVDDAAAIPITCTYAREVSSCLATNDCAASDDRCVFEGFLGSAPDGWDIATLRACASGAVTNEATCDAAIGGVTRSCLDRLEECIGGPYEGATDPPFSDDRCFSIVALTPEAIADALACLSSPCDAIGACLSTAGTFTY